MALRVVGSSPISHPNLIELGRSQAVRHGTLDPASGGSNPPAPAIDNEINNAPLAQLVEQLTLNQEVGGSIPSWRTRKFRNRRQMRFFIFSLAPYFGGCRPNNLTNRSAAARCRPGMALILSKLVPWNQAEKQRPVCYNVDRFLFVAI